MEKIMPIWQEKSQSTHEIARLLSVKYGVKTSHTGTLDPMAEGVVIILLGEERLKKYEYAKWLKEYEFDIVFNVKTDTYDGMGLITDENTADVPEDIDINDVIKDFIGEYEQTVPAYSTIKVGGKHLHEHSRANKSVSLPKRNGEIFEFEYLGNSKFDKKILCYDISQVVGDFRQDEIIKQWEGFDRELVAKKFRVKMTKGLYVRSLVQDVCEKLSMIGFTNNIVRTRNGGYTKSNSISQNK